MKKSHDLRRLSLLAIALLSLFTVAQAQDFWYKGFHYRVLDEYSAELIYMDHYNSDVYNKYKTYKGDIEIPSTVTTTVQPMYEAPYTTDLTVTRIDDHAFANCMNLKSVIIPNTVTEIGEKAFMNCENLNNVTFKGALRVISSYMFYNCLSLRHIDLPNGLEIIDTYAFANSGLHEISLPSTLREIFYQAFYGCDGLTDVVVPNGVTSLDYAFAHCRNLTAVQLPNTLEGMEGTFMGCYNLREVVIPNSVKRINAETFRWCSSLTEIVFPNSVTEIDKYSFEGCSNLASIVLGENCSLDGNSVFGDCPNLYSITSLNWKKPISYDMKDIFDNDTYGHATLYVPYGTSSSYGRTNYWKDFVNIVELPYTVEVDGFYYRIVGEKRMTICHGPMEHHYSGDIVIQDNILYGGKLYNVLAIEADAFRGVDLGPNDDLLSVEIPRSITIISESAFKDCRMLTAVRAPGVKRIKFNAFNGCKSLQSVSFGSALTEIEFSAFEECPELSSITLLGSTPPRIAPTTFMNNHYLNTTVYVMTLNVRDTFLKDESWKKFKTINAQMKKPSPVGRR